MTRFGVLRNFPKLLPTMKTNFQAQLALLRELQEIDLRLHEINLSIEALPERIAGTEHAYHQVKEEYDTTKQALAEAEKTRRHEEMELAAAVDHAKQREAKLYAIKTTKEYQAALKEIAETKKANRDREDRILSLMEEIETFSKKITQLETDIADKEAVYRKESESVKTEEENFIKTRETYEARRPEIISKLDSKVVQKYDHVRQRYADALVHVEKEVCQGCSMNIPPQLSNEMLRFNEFKNCPFCHRLIYVIKETNTADQPANEAT